MEYYYRHTINISAIKPTKCGWDLSVLNNIFGGIPIV